MHVNETLTNAQGVRLELQMFLHHVFPVYSQVWIPPYSALPLALCLLVLLDWHVSV